MLNAFLGSQQTRLKRNCGGAVVPRCGGVLVVLGTVPVRTTLSLVRFFPSWYDLILVVFSTFDRS